MAHQIILFALMVFAVIFSFKKGRAIEKISSLAFIVIAITMKYSSNEILDLGIALIPIITALLFLDSIRDKSIHGLKKFALLSIYLSSTLVYLFKFQHWAGASTLVMISIVATITSAYWLIKTRPFEERQFGIMLFLTIDLILIQFGIF